jgi:hypothetical protein
MEDKECDVAFSVEGHTSVAVVLSFLLVFRVNLAYEKWDEAREAIERVRDGVRNLNVAFCSFVCTASSASFASIGDKYGDTVGASADTKKKRRKVFLFRGRRGNNKKKKERRKKT